MLICIKARMHQTPERTGLKERNHLLSSWFLQFQSLCWQGLGERSAEVAEVKQKQGKMTTLQDIPPVTHFIQTILPPPTVSITSPDSTDNWVQPVNT